MPNCHPSLYETENKEGKQQEGKQQVTQQLTVNLHSLRDILPGEELCWSYFKNTMSYRERQEVSRNSFDFECRCQACHLSTGLSKQEQLLIRTANDMLREKLRQIEVTLQHAKEVDATMEDVLFDLRTYKEAHSRVYDYGRLGLEDECDEDVEMEMDGECSKLILSDKKSLLLKKLTDKYKYRSSSSCSNLKILPNLVDSFTTDPVFQHITPSLTNVHQSTYFYLSQKEGNKDWRNSDEAFDIRVTIEYLTGIYGLKEDVETGSIGPKMTTWS